MKDLLRRHYRALRKDLSTPSLNPLFALLHSYRNVLSYNPIGSELDLTPVNNFLAIQHRLFLPPPDPKPLPVDLILVPALAYDAEGYRLGQGGGYYDRLLALNPHIFSIGIAFQQQLCPTPLPRDPWDQKVNRVLFF